MRTKLKQFDKRDDKIYYLAKLEGKFRRAFNELNCDMTAGRLGFSNELIEELMQARKTLLKLEYTVFDKMKELSEEQNNDTNN